MGLARDLEFLVAARKPAPSRGKRAHPEDDLQRECARWLDAQGYIWFHPPNGGFRNAREAARLKGLGVKPGVPDLFILGPKGGVPAPGVAVELKSAQGRVSPAQEYWGQTLQGLGWDWVVCRSLDELQEVLAGRL